jgi:hypothetical protein
MEFVEGNPTKVSRMMQAQEVVERIKAPDGEHQPSVDVDLFISTEKIMVLNTDLEDILMDHSLRSISYIADIGDLVVLMAKRRYLQHDGSDEPNGSTTRRVVKFNQKLVCHVFESEEVSVREEWRVLHFNGRLSLSLSLSLSRLNLWHIPLDKPFKWRTSSF